MLKPNQKKGIKRSSFFIMLAEGIHRVCRKNDSHALWWFETITHGPFGIFLRPSIFQVTPHIIFREFKINKIHFDAIN